MSIVRYLDTKSPYQLLNLPKEVRDLIWGTVLIDYDPQKTRYATPSFPIKHSTINVAPDYTWRPAKRDLALLLVSKQVHRESSKIFYRKNEFRFCCFECFSLKMFGEFMSGDGEQARMFLHRPPVNGWVSTEVFKNYRLHVHKLLKPLNVEQGFGKFNHRQLIRHISLVGEKWDEPHGLLFADVDMERKNRIREKSGAIANALLLFPNLKRLDIGAGIVETFVDPRSEIGQCWQPILQILRRNDGCVNVVWQYWIEEPPLKPLAWYFDQEVYEFALDFWEKKWVAQCSDSFDLRDGLRCPFFRMIAVFSDIEIRLREMIGRCREWDATPDDYWMKCGREMTPDGRKKSIWVAFSGVPEYLVEKRMEEEAHKETIERKRCKKRKLAYRYPVNLDWFLIQQGYKYEVERCACCACMLEKDEDEGEDEEEEEDDGVEEIVVPEVDPCVCANGRWYSRPSGGGGIRRGPFRGPKWGRKVDISI